MKAMQYTEYGDADVMRIAEVADPEPGAGQILIDIHAASVNPVDWKIRQGYMKAFVDIPMPHVLGRDVSGIVLALGDGVGSLSVGDAVFGTAAANRDGTHAEFVAIDAKMLARKPERIERGGEMSAHAIGANQHHGADRIARRLLDLGTGERLALGFRGSLDLHRHPGGVKRRVEIIGDIERPVRTLPARPFEDPSRIGRDVQVQRLFVEVCRHRRAQSLHRRRCGAVEVRLASVADALGQRARQLGLRLGESERDSREHLPQKRPLHTALFLVAYYGSAPVNRRGCCLRRA